MLLVLPAASASAWGGTGHSTVAKIAENYLTKKAKKALDKYLDGKTLHEVASDGDKYRKVWLEDIGREIANPNSIRLKSWGDKFDWSLPSNIEPYPHSFTVGDNFEPIRDLFETIDGKDYEITNSIYFLDKFIKELKEGAETMDPEERSKKIRMIVHWLGDMHCPGHVGFRGDSYKAPGGSATAIKINGKKTTLHKFWDSGIFTLAFDGRRYVGMTELADCYNNVYFSKKTVKGDVWDWARSNAEIAYKTRFYNGEPIVKNRELPESFPSEMKDICLTQLRNGGYRLAAVMNYIFK